MDLLTSNNLCQDKDMNRPPPYFPQNQLSPPDEKRYRKFKIIMAFAGLLVFLALVGAGYGIYQLVVWLLG
jgi:hypothetical protein